MGQTLYKKTQSRCGTTRASKKPSLNNMPLLAYILQAPYSYIDHESFTKPGVWTALKAQHALIPLPDSTWYQPLMDGLAKTPIAMTFKSANAVLLTADQERVLFLSYNYCRYRVCKIKIKIGNHGVEQLTPRQARDLLMWYRHAQQLRDQIAQTNLALVLAMAKRTRVTDLDFPELVSEGNMALVRAIDKFDASRGFKLSTYACRAILKSFSRASIKSSKYRVMFPIEFDPTYERSNYSQVKSDKNEQDCAEEVLRIFQKNDADLTGMEQRVLEHRFSVAMHCRPAYCDRNMTLEQVGKLVGVTKERVRQIQNKALAKIKESIKQGYLK